MTVEGKDRRYFPSFKVRSGRRVVIMDALSHKEARDPARNEFTGTLTNINAALDGLTYIPAANSNGPDAVQIAVNDQGADADVNTLIRLHERQSKVEFAPKG